MSLGLQQALLEDARELLADDEEERKREEQKKLAARRRASAPASALPTRDQVWQARGSEPVKATQSSDQPAPATKKTLTDSVAASQKPGKDESDDEFGFGMTIATGTNTVHRKTPSEEGFTGMRPSRAMAAVFGRNKGPIALPGDLGPNDPRRAGLPGDLGPNDPRRGLHHSKSQSPSGRVPYTSTDQARRRRASDAAILRKEGLKSGKSGSMSEEGGVRLAKDKKGDDDDESAVDSSDEDRDSDASDDARGRDRRKRNSVGGQSDSEDEGNAGRGRHARKGKQSHNHAFVIMLSYLSVADAISRKLRLTQFSAIAKHTGHSSHYRSLQSQPQSRCSSPLRL